MNGDYQPVERAAVTSSIKTEAVSDERLAKLVPQLTENIRLMEHRLAKSAIPGESWETAPAFADAKLKLALIIELLSRRAANNAVGVKALEWQAIGPPGSDIVADTPFGQYTYSKSGRGWALYFGDDLNCEPDDEQACRTAAQADFNTRILSSISPVQEEKPVALYGPYGWLNGHRGLSEDSWHLESDPLENNEEDFAIPLYAKVDPFVEVGKSIPVDFTRPASPVSAEVTEAQIEAAARAMHDHRRATDSMWTPWKDMPDDYRENSLAMVRVGFAALFTQGREAE